MKNLILILLFIPIVSFSQSKDSLITYSEIIVLDSISKDQLFNNGRDWFNSTFKSSKDVLQIIDKESGQLAGKGILGGTFTINYFGSHSEDLNCHFNVDLRVKDGKYKYTFSNFSSETYFPILTSSSESPKINMISQERSNEWYSIYKTTVNEQMKGIIKSLKISMQKRSDDGF